MKTLPDNPNLNHLRQQAKDVLPQLRASEPSASLADAQASVAEQYGFRTWTDLKAEVDRRRAVVHAADPALAAQVAAAFGLGKPVAPMLPVERGWAGQIWTIETDRGRWVATELFEWISLDNVDTEVGLVERARAAGIRAPTPVRSTDGAVAAEVAGRNWRVHESIKLGPVPMLPIAPATAASVGTVLATLHGLALPAPGPITPWLTYSPTEAHWQTLLSGATRANAPWAPRLAEAIPIFVDVATITDDDPNLATILSHCSMGPSNVHVAGEDGPIIVGWEHASATPPRWELASALHSWGSRPDGEVHEPAVQALITGYRERGQSTDGLDLGAFTSAIAAELNWTATRVSIALKDDRADEARRAVAAREVPTLLAHPFSRARLERILDAAASAPAPAVAT